MKKINTTKLMALLASACLITSSFVGSTLAKYTTTANADDTARVAKWGVVLQADGSLYGTNYGTGANSVPTTDDTVANLSVKAAANAVAPGTENKDGLSFAVLGVPEVRTQLTVTIADMKN